MTNDTLINRLEEIVDAIHIDEVKDIISSLAKIDSFKHIIEDDLCTQVIYKKISYELKKEFGINNFKIVQLTNSIETILFQLGDNENFTYNYVSKVSPDTFIIIFVDDNELSNFEELTLNSYFNEIVHLLYIQFILTNLQESTLIDPLTKLKNRISFNEEMKVLVPLALREKMKIGVLMINIDRFRAVNDEHGNEFGDKFLKMYADVIKETIRSSDMAVRFAGGEFLVLLVNVENELKTIEIANKLREKLAHSYIELPNSDKFKKTVCIGVSMFPEDSAIMDESVKYAQDAASDASDKSRNIVLRYEKENEGIIDFF